MKKMKRLRQSLCLFIFVFVLTACSGTGGKATPTLVPTPVTVEKPVYTVQRGTVTEVVQLTGRVAPVQQENLYFRSDGVVKEVLVSAGDSVEEDTVLARLDEPEQYQANVAATELAYLEAQRNLEQVKLDMPINLAEAKLALEDAAEELEKAQAAVDALAYPRVVDSLTLEKFRTDFAITEQKLQSAQARYDNLAGRPETDPIRADALNALIEARRAHYLATINLNWAKGEYTEAEIDQIHTELDLAKANYEKAAAEVDLWGADSPTSELAMAELILADAEARFAMAQKALEAVELRAPFAGQVLSLGIAPGSSVSAFQSVITLADPAVLEIRAVPDAEDLEGLSVGQQALVRLSSQSGEEFTATVTGLPMTGTAAGDENGVDQSVHLQLEDESVPLVLSDAAVILITIDEREDVLWLPPAALRSFQGETFVFVDLNGVQRRVNVSVGLVSADRVEIVSGLEEGQTVIGQ
jgi:multidrug efflux pump subunit AcrA (membrane-fusion protein)